MNLNRLMRNVIDAWNAYRRYPDTSADIERLDKAVNAQRAAMSMPPPDAIYVTDTGHACDAAKNPEMELAQNAQLYVPAQPTQDSTGWCEYVAGMVDHWMRSEGADKLKTDEDRRVKAIAGIIERRLWALQREPSAQQKAAAKTLAHIGYTYHGGELWKPPLGERPKWLDYEPAGFLLHWPAPGGGRDILWSKDGAAGRASGCPVTEIFKSTETTKEKTT